MNGILMGDELRFVSESTTQDFQGLPSLDNFCLVYQPIVDVDTGEVTAAEALLRMVGEDGRKISPAEMSFSLCDYAPDMSLINWLIAEALSAQRVLKKNNIDIALHVNLQPGELLNQDFTRIAQKMLTDAARANVKPLSFELVESSELVNIVHATTIMDACCQKGVTFALDDFGTSFSTLQQLRFLPADTIKLDKSFVMNIVTSEEDLLFVKEIIGFCHRLGRKVVCEGVCETQIGRILKYLNCDYLQGYAISKPMALNDFVNWHEVVHSGATWWNT